MNKEAVDILCHNEEYRLSIFASRQITDADLQFDPVIETKEEREARLSVYHAIKRQLLVQGIPENEIAFVHDYDGPAAQAELSRKVNAGEIRIVLASTAKPGVGANIQERLYALHHLDAPWRPADIEQREGRILRQRQDTRDCAGGWKRLMLR